MITSFKTEQLGIGFDFDIALEPNKQIYCFIGKNGIGKTQLLENMAKSLIYSHSMFITDQTKTFTHQNLFQQIRKYREQNSSDNSLLLLWETLKNEFKEDWLGALEILELAAVDSNKTALANEIRIYLNAQINMYPRFTKLINDGLKIIDTKLKFE